MALTLPQLWVQATRPHVWSIAAVLLLAGQISGVFAIGPWWVVFVMLFPAVLAGVVSMVVSVGPALIAILESYLERRLAKQAEKDSRS